MLRRNGFDVQQILQTAKLPADLFNRAQINLDEAKYYAFLDAVAAQTPDQATLVRLVTAADIETFAAPILAAYCSENGQRCIERLAQYKQLIGPAVYQLTRTDAELTITLRSRNELPMTS